jgi:hypothetical protein
MVMVSVKLRLFFLFLIFLLSGPVLADEVALDLSTMPGTDCGVDWTEGPCVLWFEAITAEDYQPVQPPQLICFPFMSGSTLILFPARLCIDLTGVQGIESIQVDIGEGAEMAATRVMIYLGDLYIHQATSTDMGYHTVTLPVDGLPYDTLIISGWETAVTGIRLIGTTLVDDQDIGFGSVKALYR